MFQVIIVSLMSYRYHDLLLINYVEFDCPLGAAKIQNKHVQANDLCTCNTSNINQKLTANSLDIVNDISL